MATAATKKYESLFELMKRSEKTYRTKYLGALVEGIEVMKQFRNSAKSNFQWLKLEAKSTKGWEKGGGVENDYISLCVDYVRAQIQYEAVKSLYTQVSVWDSTGAKTSKLLRLMPSAKLYLKEIELLVGKAERMLEEHIAQEAEKGKKK